MLNPPKQPTHRHLPLGSKIKLDSSASSDRAAAATRSRNSDAGPCRLTVSFTNDAVGPEGDRNVRVLGLSAE